METIKLKAETRKGLDIEIYRLIACGWTVYKHPKKTWLDTWKSTLHREIKK